MASTYSSRLRIELMGSGEQSGSWGTKTNTNLGTLIEEAIAGWESIATGDANVTLTANDGATDQARKAILRFTGALTANRNIIVPTVSKIYFIDNACSGSYGLVVKTSAGSGITVPNGTKTVLYCDGTNVVDATNWFSSISLGSALPISSGGTGSTTASAALSALGIGSSRPIFIASKSVDQTGVADITWTKVTFTTEVSDVGGYYDSTNSKWTPPSGPVLLNASIYLSGTYAAGSAVYAALYKNGAAVAYLAPVYSQRTNLNFLNIAFVDLANGSDYYEVYVYMDVTSGTGTVVSNVVTFFQGVWLG